jgi:hypothetical protein
LNSVISPLLRRPCAVDDLADFCGDVIRAESTFADPQHDVAGLDERSRTRVDEQAGAVSSTGSISRSVSRHAPTDTTGRPASPSRFQSQAWATTWRAR